LKRWAILFRPAGLEQIGLRNRDLRRYALVDAWNRMGSKQVLLFSGPPCYLILLLLNQQHKEQMAFAIEQFVAVQATLRI
jgi:hypothetical protein